jgi:hypothetical protein
MNSSPTSASKKANVVGAVAGKAGELLLKAKGGVDGITHSPSIEKPVGGGHSRGKSSDGIRRRPSLGIRRGSAKPKVDYTEELENARLAQVDVEEALVQCEKRHSAQMVAALDSLEELERTRLIKLKKVLLKAAQAEKRMLDKTATFLSDDATMFNGFAEVDPAEDINKTSEKLMLTTKSTLPTLNAL